MLAVCGGGGSDVAAFLVTALAVAAWGLVAAFVIKTARERRERKALIVLALVSSLVGPAIFLGLLDGFYGDSDRLPELVLVLSIPGLIGTCVAVGMRAAHPARALLLWLWGAVFLPGAYIVLVISVLAVGTACLS